MTNRIAVAQVPGPLEAYARHFDPVFRKSNQREGFRHSLEGLLLRVDSATAPSRQGVLVIDETGDRKDAHQTAHVARQYLGNVGKIDNGVVSVTSLWADEHVYSPLEVEPYTPESYFAQGKHDPAFRTKPNIALQLVHQAMRQEWPFRAVVAASLYGEDRSLREGLGEC